MRKRRDDIHTTPDVTHIHNPEVAHEASDVNIKAILQFTLGLLLFGILVSVLMWGLLKFFEKRSARQEQKSRPGPMALTEKERLPSEPRLQAAPGFGDDLELGEGKNLALMPPETEYKVLSERWKMVLDYGQKDPKTGEMTVLPIEQAIKKLVEQGLPARPQAEGQKSFEQSREFPAYSSAGRTMEVRRQ